MKQYHAPPSFTTLVSNIYSDLSATVTSRYWSTGVVPINVGVYQGDPLSAVIFNTVMMTLADSLKAEMDCGYTFSQSRRSTNILQYADDTCLITNGPASCQKLLSKVNIWIPLVRSDGLQVTEGCCWLHKIQEGVTGDDK